MATSTKVTAKIHRKKTHNLGLNQLISNAENSLKNSGIYGKINKQSPQNSLKIPESFKGNILPCSVQPRRSWWSGLSVRYSSIQYILEMTQTWQA